MRKLFWLFVGLTVLVGLSYIAVPSLFNIATRGHRSDRIVPSTLAYVPPPAPGILIKAAPPEEVGPDEDWWW